MFSCEYQFLYTWSVCKCLSILFKNCFVSAQNSFADKIRLYSGNSGKNLNENLPVRWIGRGRDEDSFLMKWPSRSSDMSPCNFFFGDMWRNWSMLPPLLASIDGLKQRITSPLDNVTGDMLQRVWQKLNYRFDLCRVTGDSHIEHLWNRSHNKLFSSIGLDLGAFKIIALKMMSFFGGTPCILLEMNIPSI